jgi:hypothetical protein
VGGKDALAACYRLRGRSACMPRPP